jgi:hypothetical protein
MLYSTSSPSPFHAVIAAAGLNVLLASCALVAAAGLHVALAPPAFVITGVIAALL